MFSFESIGWPLVINGGGPNEKYKIRKTSMSLFKNYLFPKQVPELVIRIKKLGFFYIFM